MCARRDNQVIYVKYNALLRGGVNMISRERCKSTARRTRRLSNDTYEDRSERTTITPGIVTTEYLQLSHGRVEAESP